MVNAQDIIAKAKQLLDEIEKMGVGEAGGGDVEHQAGPFGQVSDETSCDPEDDEAMPKCIGNETGFKRSKLAMKEQPDGVQKSDVEMIQGGFGTTDELIPEDDFYLPTSVMSENNCTGTGKRCKAKHKSGVSTREVYNSGEDLHHLSGEF